MKKIIVSIISILLLPITIIFFLAPLFVYFVPAMNIQFVLIVARILLLLWSLVFLFSIVFLSSYCGFLCPLTRIFTLAARITKNKDILSHRFPKSVGIITQTAWLAAFIYVFLRSSGNSFGFLHNVSAFSHMELIILFCFYGIAAVLLNTRVGRDELGHYLCPLSPFQKAGIELNRRLRLPGFRIILNSSRCKNCGQCNRICTYQNDVISMVKANEMNYKLCSNCGKCISACKNKAIIRQWSK